MAAVLGVPMKTTGRTPEEAVETWLALYGGVFGDPVPDIEVSGRMRLIPKGEIERAVVRGAQWMEGRRVSGAVVRALCVKSEGTWAPAYIAMKIADEPQGGLGEPTVLPAAATQTASNHPAAANLNAWEEPALQVMFDDLSTPRVPARLTWSVHGREAAGRDSPADRIFRVDARTGEVWRVDPAVASFADITGTVTGWATPGTLPDSDDDACLNLPQEMALPMLKVTALDGSTPVATTFTDAGGDYILQTGSGTYTVKMELVGPNWTIFDHTNSPQYSSVSLTFTDVSNGTTGLDGEFNDNPSEYVTAQVNGHLQVAKAREFFLSRIYVDDEWVGLFNNTLGVLVNVDCFAGCPNAQATANGIWFTYADGSGRNMAYSTAVAHEYGHWAAHNVYGIDITSEPEQAWHEGFADCVGHLVHDTRLLGEDWKGCGTFVRDPESPVHTYPECANEQHVRGTVLSGSFWDIREAVGLSETQQLFVDWAFIATGARPGIEPCPSKYQSADALTLQQVLIADDDDGDLSNGTPNLAAICDAFGNHDIFDENYCGESAPRPRVPDWDRSGVVDAFDAIGFLAAIQRGDARADVNGDRVLDVFDIIAFASAYADAAGHMQGGRS